MNRGELTRTEQADVPESAHSTCDWRGTSDPGYRCRCRAAIGSRCLFHAEDKGTHTAAFWGALNDQLLQAGESQEGMNRRADFTGYVFPGDTAIVVGEIAGVQQPSVVGLPGSLLDNLTMNEVVIRGHLKVSTPAQLMSRLTITALKMEVHGDADFSCARLRSLTLRRAHIRGGLSLAGVNASHALDLRQAHVDGDVLLQEARLNGGLFAGRLATGGSVFLSGCRVAETADFRDATLVGAMCFDSACLTGRVRLDGCTAKSIFLGDRKPSLFGLNRRGVACPGDRRSSFSFWRFARQMYIKNDDNESADRAYYFERISKWKAGWRESSSRGWFLTILRAPFYGVGYMADFVFLRMATAYGASLYRLFAAWGAIAGVFAILYRILDVLLGHQFVSVLPTTAAAPMSFGTALYLSVGVFTSLGTGNLQPATGLAAALVTAEAASGMVLVSLTLLVIGRRFLRER